MQPDAFLSHSTPLISALTGVRAPLAADALDVNRLEPSRSHYLRDPTGVVPIGLHRHG